MEVVRNKLPSGYMNQATSQELNTLMQVKCISEHGDEVADSRIKRHERGRQDIK